MHVRNLISWPDLPQLVSKKKRRHIASYVLSEVDCTQTDSSCAHAALMCLFMCQENVSSCILIGGEEGGGEGTTKQDQTLFKDLRHKGQWRALSQQEQQQEQLAEFVWPAGLAARWKAARQQTNKQAQSSKASSGSSLVPVQSSPWSPPLSLSPGLGWGGEGEEQKKKPRNAAQLQGGSGDGRRRERRRRNHPTVMMLMLRSWGWWRESTHSLCSCVCVSTEEGGWKLTGPWAWAASKRERGTLSHLFSPFSLSLFSISLSLLPALSYVETWRERERGGGGERGGPFLCVGVMNEFWGTWEWRHPPLLWVGDALMMDVHAHTHTHTHTQNWAPFLPPSTTTQYETGPLTTISLLPHKWKFGWLVVSRQHLWTRRSWYMYSPTTLSSPINRNVCSKLDKVWDRCVEKCCLRKLTAIQKHSSCCSFLLLFHQPAHPSPLGPFYIMIWHHVPPPTHTKIV